MEPYKYLQQVAQALPGIEDKDQLNQLLDEVEFLYEALEPALQELAEQLMTAIQERL